MTVVDLVKLLNIPQAAKRCPYSEAQLRNRINDGRLKAIRLAGAVYVHQDDLDAFLKSYPAAQ